MYIRIELYAQTYLSLLYYNFRKGYLFFIKKLIKKVMLFLIKKETTNILCRFRKKYRWRLSGSNRRPFACHANALPAELSPPNSMRYRNKKLSQYRFFQIFVTMYSIP